VGTAGQTVSSQGSINYDADHHGSNEATRLTDDTTLTGAANATEFVVNSGVPQTIGIGFAGTGTAACTLTVNGPSSLKATFALSGTGAAQCGEHCYLLQQDQP
jgi:hypothetical protein